MIYLVMIVSYLKRTEFDETTSRHCLFSTDLQKHLSVCILSAMLCRFERPPKNSLSWAYSAICRLQHGVIAMFTSDSGGSRASFIVYQKIWNFYNSLAASTHRILGFSTLRLSNIPVLQPPLRVVVHKCLSISVKRDILPRKQSMSD